MFGSILDFFRLDDTNWVDYDAITFESFHPDSRVWGKRYSPDITYIRKMQTAYQTAIERIDELEHELARSSNSTYLEEAQAVVGLHRTDLLRIAELEAENEKLTVLYEFYRNRMLELDEKITARQESKETNGEIHTMKKDNKYASTDGISKMDKMKLATCYDISGWNLQDISDKLNVKPATIKQYIATAGGHYAINNWYGGKLIQWDKEYGGESWNLEQFAPSATADNGSEKAVSA